LSGLDLFHNRFATDPDWNPAEATPDANFIHTLRAVALTSCPDREEMTGIRFEKERVYGYSGGAKALPGRPLAPAIAPIRGSRR
jgi:hypothetical protein